ncbi:DUF6287 domain-containing protein [Lactobacillus bombicola]|uniref:Uncharacterized protein n=1 Tax=Lactobacillus bombicola TaxID=1505723 RepID=A0A396SSV9_9LACO|nr:DUF6287 domain-containing protein [Lactobacillus bombicola]RHW50615.1 hypothetical protein DS833_04900 [Lactobacillus bombicola]RHW54726.1 hypothetical protein DS835_03755 [Lactobacillus bombicola]
MKKIVTAVFSTLLMGLGLITTSSTTINATVATNNSTSKMNFKQIKKGDYTSLLGKWKQVAGMHNDYRKGITWYKLDPKHPIFKLKITKHQIKEFSGDGRTKFETFHGKYITVKSASGKGYESAKLKWSKNNHFFGASEDVGAINYTITFYPKNVPIYDDKYHRKQPKEIDNKKDRIELWCSNMGSVQIFQRN